MDQFGKSTALCLSLPTNTLMRHIHKTKRVKLIALTHLPLMPMCQWIMSALVLIMACRQFGANPLSDQCCVIVNLTLRNKLSEIESKYKTFHSRKMHLKISSAKRWSFCPGREELNSFCATCSEHLKHILIHFNLTRAKMFSKPET